MQYIRIQVIHEYLTNLMDSDTVLTLENTDEAIRRAQNYMQRQDNDGEKHVAFSSTSDESTHTDTHTHTHTGWRENDEPGIYAHVQYRALWSNVQYRALRCIVQ